LIVMGVAARQTVIINKDLQFALAQRRTVEIRQVVDAARVTCIADW
jgi:hypothetical protein